MEDTKLVNFAQYLAGMLGFAVLLSMGMYQSSYLTKSILFLSIIIFLAFALKIRSKITLAYTMGGVIWFVYVVLFFAFFMVVGGTFVVVLKSAGLTILGTGMLYIISSIIVFTSVVIFGKIHSVQQL